MAKNSASDASTAYYFRQQHPSSSSSSPTVAGFLSRDTTTRQMSPNFLRSSLERASAQTLSLSDDNIIFDNREYPLPRTSFAGIDDDFWDLNNTVHHYFSADNTLTVDVMPAMSGNNKHFKIADDHNPHNRTLNNNIYTNIIDYAAEVSSAVTSPDLFAAASSQLSNMAAQIVATTTAETTAAAAASNHSCEGWLWAQGSAGNFGILTIGMVADAVIVLLNCIVLLSFALQPGIRRSSNLYILNLALCDLMTGVNTIPYRFTMDVSGCWPYSSLIPCRVSTTLSWITINEAALTIVLIAYDRLLKVRLGAAFAQKETVSVVLRRLALSWVANIVVWTGLNWVHVYTGKSLSEPSACHTEFFQLPIEAVIVILMLSYFVPPLVCCMIYVWVWKLMYVRRKKLDNKRNNGVMHLAVPSSTASTTSSSRLTTSKDVEAGGGSHAQRSERIQLLPNGNHHHSQPPPLLNNNSNGAVVVPDGTSMASIATNDSGHNSHPVCLTNSTHKQQNGGGALPTPSSRTVVDVSTKIVSSDGSSRRRLAGGHLDRMTRMLILISCIFMILWLPNGILAVTIGFVGREMQLNGRSQSLYELYTNLVRVTMIAQYCLYFNSAINPALYAFGFPAIREAMIKSVLPRALWIKWFASSSSSQHKQQKQQQQHQNRHTTAALTVGGTSSGGSAGFIPKQ